MFNLTGSEIVVILLLALVVLGPDKLPEAMRKAGKMWGELRKLSAGFQDEVRKGFEEPTREVRETASAVKKAAAFDLSPTKGAVKSLLQPPKPGVAASKPDAEPAPAAETDTEPTPAAETDIEPASAAKAESETDPAP